VRENIMSIAEQSAPIAEVPRKKRIGVEGYVLIVGVAAIAIYGLARFAYEPSWQTKEVAMRAAMATEHAKVCDQLGKPAGTPDAVKCLALLDGLYTTHKEAFIADNSEI
jgi:hypothetical protein